MRDISGMGMWIAAARTLDGQNVGRPPVMIGGAERMLAGKQDARGQPNACQRTDDWDQFDGFGTSADDDRDTMYAAQPSP